MGSVIDTIITAGVLIIALPILAIMALGLVFWAMGLGG